MCISHNSTLSSLIFLGGYNSLHRCQLQLKLAAEKGSLPPFSLDHTPDMMKHPVVVINSLLFVLVKQVARSFKSSCYIGYDCSSKRRVFVKISYSCSDNLYHEASVLNILRKVKSIPKLVAVGTDSLGLGDSVVLVTTHIKGQNLMSRFEQYGAFRDAQLHKIGRQLTIILQQIHSHIIIHSDIKPSNIIVGAYGCVYLVDFEFAIPIGSGAVRGGTSLFASLNSLQNLPPTPSDDFESLRYTLDFLQQGKLPWEDSIFFVDMINLRKQFYSQKVL